MKNSTGRDSLGCVVAGAMLGGASGLVAAFLLVGLAVAGGGVAQGIADADFSPAFIFLGSIGVLVGGFVGGMVGLRVSEPTSGKKMDRPITWDEE